MGESADRGEGKGRKGEGDGTEENIDYEKSGLIGISKMAARPGRRIAEGGRASLAPLRRNKRLL